MIVKAKPPKVVVIGGGTGTFSVLTALRKMPLDISALMTMVDDGGSNRILRDEFGLLPTSGIRQAMVALSKKEDILRKLFMYRYHSGVGITGMTFGNLFLAAMADILGSQDKAISATADFLHVKGKIMPISWDDVRLVAEYEDGSTVMGEHRIDEPKHDGKLRIRRLSTIPAATISAEAKAAIAAADFIILGPGDLYGNSIANLVIRGTVEEILKNRGKLIFILNLMTKYGETYNYTASDYLEDLGKYLDRDRLDYVVINSDTDFAPEMLSRYLQENTIPVADDLETMSLPEKIKVIREDLVSREEVKTEKGDVIRRSMIRHDTRKLQKLLGQIISGRK